MCHAVLALPPSPRKWTRKAEWVASETDLCKIHDIYQCFRIALQIWITRFPVTQTSSQFECTSGICMLYSPILSCAYLFPYPMSSSRLFNWATLICACKIWEAHVELPGPGRGLGYGMRILMFALLAHIPCLPLFHPAPVPLSAELTSASGQETGLPASPAHSQIIANVCNGMFVSTSAVIALVLVTHRIQPLDYLLLDMKSETVSCQLNTINECQLSTVKRQILKSNTECHIQTSSSWWIFSIQHLGLHYLANINPLWSVFRSKVVSTQNTVGNTEQFSKNITWEMLSPVMWGFRLLSLFRLYSSSSQTPWEFENHC